MLLTLILVLQLPGNPPPSLPFVVPEPCDEYCEPIWTVCRAVTLHAEESTASATVDSAVPGDTLDALMGRLHVTKPDLVVFRDTMRWTWYHYPDDPPSPDTVVFTPRDTLYVLRYSGTEGGVGLWWLRGKFREGEDFWVSSSYFRAPLTWIEGDRAWWVQVRRRTSRAVGWLQVRVGDVAGLAPEYDDEPGRCARR